MPVNNNISSILIPYDKIKFTPNSKPLGEGGFGIVSKAIWQHIDVAVKELKIKSLAEDASEEFEQEAAQHSRLHHCNVVTLYGVCIESPHYCLVMELMPDGPLYKLLHSKSDLPWLRRIDIARQIAIGLSYLHEQKIIHRDLKSFNVLLKGTEAKLADFGLSKVKVETATTTMGVQQGAGSLLWMAPELFKRRARHNELSDIYALGMVLWEIASRQLPFEDSTGNQDLVRQWVLEGERDEIPEDTPQNYAALIEQCWAPEPSSRPQTADILVENLLRIFELYDAKSNKSWHFDGNTKRSTASQVQDAELVPATPEDFQKVVEQYQRYPAEGYEIQKVDTVYNPVLNRMFADNLKMLQIKHNNPAFSPKFTEENDVPANKKWRSHVHHMWQVMSAPYTDDSYPQVKLLPLWHGTSETVLGSILKTGYANLATTDCGYFGKGLYSTNEAEYAWKYYSKGTLILNWVASFSAYPVIAGDMEKVTNKGNYANYDTHFVPITSYYANNPDNFVPENPADCFLPCRPYKKHQYIEVVVFQQAQCLPRYVVTLQKSLLPSPMSSPSTRGQSAKFGRRASGLTSSSNAMTSSYKDSANISHSATAIAEFNQQQQKIFTIEEYARKQLQAEEPSQRIAIITRFKSERENILKKSKYTPQELTTFLHHVGFGEQAEAEKMLQVNKNLALAKGTLTDCAERIFTEITGFQYALWALDWHMWEMIKKYLPTAAITEQLQMLGTGPWVEAHGTTTNWQPLINALWTLINNWDRPDEKTWSHEQKNNHWCKQVGGAQLLLPAHFINQYSSFSFSYEDGYSFTKPNAGLPRVGVDVWKNPPESIVKAECTLDNQPACLGTNFAWDSYPLMGHSVGCYVKWKHNKIEMCHELFELRSNQLTELKAAYLKPAPTPHCRIS